MLNRFTVISRSFSPSRIILSSPNTALRFQSIQVRNMSKSLTAAIKEDHEEVSVSNARVRPTFFVSKGVQSWLREGGNSKPAGFSFEIARRGAVHFSGLGHHRTVFGSSVGFAVLTVLDSCTALCNTRDLIKSERRRCSPITKNNKGRLDRRHLRRIRRSA